MQQLADRGAQAGAIAQVRDALAPVLRRENELVRSAVVGRQEPVDPALCAALKLSAIAAKRLSIMFIFSALCRWQLCLQREAKMQENEQSDQRHGRKAECMRS